MSYHLSVIEDDIIREASDWPDPNSLSDRFYGFIGAQVMLGGEIIEEHVSTVVDGHVFIRRDDKDITVVMRHDDHSLIGNTIPTFISEMWS